MLVICDSSPLIALAHCDLLTLLDKLFSDIIVPREVFNEINVADKQNYDKICSWASGKIQNAENRQLFNFINQTLDPGESAAIVLYWEKSADLLLVDEKKARRMAAQSGIRIIGTTGILLAAKEQQLIPVIKPFLDQLMDSSFHISRSLYERTLKMAGE